MSDLWRAVLHRALIDLTTNRDRGWEKIKAETVAWLDTEDFHDVCDLSDVEPSRMLRVMVIATNATQTVQSYCVLEAGRELRREVPMFLQILGRDS